MTPVSPFLLVDFPNDCMSIPLLRLVVTKTVVMKKTQGFVSQKRPNGRVRGRKVARIRKGFMKGTTSTH